MLDTDPYGPPQDNPAVDQQQRWLPHPSAVQHGQATLAVVPEAGLAVIPLFEPGKTRALWTSGQQVCTVHGVVLLSQNTANSAGLIPGLNRMRDMASLVTGATFGPTYGRVSAPHLDLRMLDHERVLAPPRRRPWPSLVARQRR